MEIKTKCNIDSEVYFIWERSVYSGRVTKITTVSQKKSNNPFDIVEKEKFFTIVEYIVKFETKYGQFVENFKEDHLFNSKEELLNSL